jgi:hypothetical protein
VSTSFFTINIRELIVQQISVSIAIQGIEDSICEILFYSFYSQIPPSMNEGYSDFFVQSMLQIFPKSENSILITCEQFLL